MKKFFLTFVLVFLACFVQAQMPIFRNAFTTNVPGAWVRGNTVFGNGGAGFFVVDQPFTNVTGNAYFGGGETFFADGINVEQPSTFWDIVTTSNRFQVINPNPGPGGLYFFVGTNTYGTGTPWFLITNGLVGIGGYPVSGYGLDVFGTAHATLLVSAGDIYAGTTSRFLWNVANTPVIGRDYGGVTIVPTAGVTNILAIRNTNSIDVVVVNSNGFTGILTNRPTVALEVHGTVRSTNFQLILPEWDDVRIPLSSLSSPSATPGRVTFRGGLAVYGFDDNSTEQLNFELQWPHGIDTNNAYGIRMHLHWTATNAIAGANSNVVWGLEYSWANPLQTYNLTTITNLFTNGLIAPHVHCIAVMSTITNVKESGVLIGRIFREGANGGDTFTGDAMGVSLDAHYPRKQMGSHAEYGDY